MTVGVRTKARAVDDDEESSGESEVEPPDADDDEEDGEKEREDDQNDANKLFDDEVSEFSVNANPAETVRQ